MNLHDELRNKITLLKDQIDQQEKIIDAIEKYAEKQEIERRMQEIYGLIKNPSKVEDSSKMIANYQKQIDRLINSFNANNEKMLGMLN